MNYEDMSDYEINKMIAENLGVYFSRHEDYDSDVCIKEFNKHDKSKWILTIANYCENASDAWPIIEWMFNEGLTLVMNDGGVVTSTLGKKYNHKSFDLEGGPLRCCMIVYLMMQEAE